MPSQQQQMQRSVRHWQQLLQIAGSHRVFFCSILSAGSMTPRALHGSPHHSTLLHFYPLYTPPVRAHAFCTCTLHCALNCLPLVGEASLACVWVCINMLSCAESSPCRWASIALTTAAVRTTTIPLSVKQIANTYRMRASICHIPAELVLLLTCPALIMSFDVPFVAESDA